GAGGRARRQDSNLQPPHRRRSTGADNRHEGGALYPLSYVAICRAALSKGAALKLRGAIISSEANLSTPRMLTRNKTGASGQARRIASSMILAGVCGQSPACRNAIRRARITRRQAVEIMRRNSGSKAVALERDRPPDR